MPAAHATRARATSDVTLETSAWLRMRSTSSGDQLSGVLCVSLNSTGSGRVPAFTSAT